MNYPDSNRYKKTIKLTRVKICPFFKYDFHSEANLTGLENPNVWNNGPQNEKEYKMLVGENYTEFIQTSPAILGMHKVFLWQLILHLSIFPFATSILSL